MSDRERAIEAAADALHDQWATPPDTAHEGAEYVLDAILALTPPAYYSVEVVDGWVNGLRELRDREQARAERAEADLAVCVEALRWYKQYGGYLFGTKASQTLFQLTRESGCGEPDCIETRPHAHSWAEASRLDHNEEPVPVEETP